MLGFITAMIKYSLFILVFLIYQLSYAQELVDFGYSECLSDDETCEYKEAQILELDKSENELQLRFTAFANCIGKFESQIRLVDDSTLNIGIGVEPLNSGEIEVYLCDCLFEFKTTIKNISSSKINKILINGRTFDEQNPKYTIETVDNNWTEKKLLETDSVFTIVDNYPIPEIGFDSLYQLLSKTILENLPKRSNPDNKLYIMYVIDKKGIVSNIQLLKGLETEFQEVVLNTIEALNISFQPGMVDGIPVNTKMAFPINLKTKPTKR